VLLGGRRARFVLLQRYSLINRDQQSSLYARRGHFSFHRHSRENSVHSEVRYLPTWMCIWEMSRWLTLISPADHHLLVKRISDQLNGIGDSLIKSYGASAQDTQTICDQMERLGDSLLAIEIHLLYWREEVLRVLFSGIREVHRTEAAGSDQRLLQKLHQDCSA